MTLVCKIIVLLVYQFSIKFWSCWNLCALNKRIWNWRFAFCLLDQLPFICYSCSYSYCCSSCCCYCCILCKRQLLQFMVVVCAIFAIQQFAQCKIEMKIVQVQATNYSYCNALMHLTLYEYSQKQVLIWVLSIFYIKACELGRNWKCKHVWKAANSSLLLLFSYMYMFFFFFSLLLLFLFLYCAGSFSRC